MSGALMDGTAELLDAISCNEIEKQNTKNQYRYGIIPFRCLHPIAIRDTAQDGVVVQPGASAESYEREDLQDNRNNCFLVHRLNSNLDVLGGVPSLPCKMAQTTFEKIDQSLCKNRSAAQ